jgi:hypothetical protein
MHHEGTDPEAITRGQSIKPFSMNRKTVTSGVRLIILGLLLTTSGCESVSSEANRNFKKSKEGNAMEMTQTDIVHASTIPPIDVSTPTKMETATFALG